MMKRFQHIVLVLATATGAACTTSDDVWTPPTADGKPLAAIRGDEIPSDFADMTKFYASARSINAPDLHGVDAATLELAQKADGILPNGLPNHILEIEELVQLETPDRWRTLSPSEQAAMPSLWHFLQVDLSKDPITEAH